MSKRSTEHYVNNKDFLKAMKEYKNSILQAKEEKKDPPKINNYIGECIMLIAQRLSNNHNFINYPFKEEMISDGIENCLMYINNFDPNKSSNPFAYFTQIVYYAFVRRIQKEKKYLYTKYKSIQNSMTIDFYENSNEKINAPNKYISEYSDNYMHEFIENFENHKNKKKKLNKTKKKKSASLIKFFESNNE